MGNDAKHVDKDAVFTNYQPITSKVFFVSLLVEFLGVCFFQFLGGSVNPKSPMVPWWVPGAGSLQLLSRPAAAPRPLLAPSSSNTHWASTAYACKA